MTESLKNSVLSIIHKRKSVRSFVPHKKVSKEDLLELVKAGMAAPSSKNAQPWMFVIFDDDKAIADIVKLNPYAQVVKNAGAGILLAADTTKSDKIAPDAWIQDLATAAENILLAAEAMGLGACWCQIYSIEDRIASIRQATNIPQSIMPFNFIAIGYCSGFDEPKNKWNPRRVHWNKWESKL